MIARLIAASARNIMLVLIATAFAVAAGLYAHLASAARRDPGPLGYAGHRLHRVSGQAPQVVEDQVTYPLTTRC
jgi:Cu(I)/Ag(I) efflux system membrane protein CusA/SilA